MIAHLLDWPEHADLRGHLAVAEGTTLPIEVKRVFWLYGVPPLVHRAGHALRTCSQLLIAVYGTYKVRVEDQSGEHVSVTLDKPNRGLLVPPMVWRDLLCLLPASVLLVLADQPFNEADYIRKHTDFIPVPREP